MGTIDVFPIVPVCDFCLSLEIYRDYHTPDYLLDAAPYVGPSLGKVIGVVPETAFAAIHSREPIDLKQPTTLQRGSSGDWAACKQCSDLIEKGHWQALENRSVKFFIRRHHPPAHTIPMLRHEIHLIHESFRKHLIRKTD